MLIIITGGTCTGKTTLQKDLNRIYGIKTIVPYTCRKPRDGEVDREDYHFISKSKWEKLRNTEEFFLEYSCFTGKQKYGTKADDYLRAKEEDLSVIVPLENVEDVEDYAFYNQIPHEIYFLTASLQTRCTRYLSRFNHEGQNKEFKEKDLMEMVRRVLTDNGKNEAKGLTWQTIDTDTLSPENAVEWALSCNAYLKFNYNK